MIETTLIHLSGGDIQGEVFSGLPVHTGKHTLKVLQCLRVLADGVATTRSSAIDGAIQPEVIQCLLQSESFIIQVFSDLVATEVGL